MTPSEKWELTAPTKRWLVFGKHGAFLGRVWSKRKGWAMALAERDLKAQPGFYVVNDDVVRDVQRTASRDAHP